MRAAVLLCPAECALFCGRGFLQSHKPTPRKLPPSLREWLAASSFARSGLLPSTRSLPVRTRNYDRTADVCHVSADRWVCFKRAPAHTHVNSSQPESLDSSRPHDRRCPREKSLHLAHSRTRTRDGARNQSSSLILPLDLARSALRNSSQSSVGAYRSHSFFRFMQAEHLSLKKPS